MGGALRLELEPPEALYLQTPAPDRLYSASVHMVFPELRESCVRRSQNLMLPASVFFPLVLFFLQLLLLILLPCLHLGFS